MCTPALADAWAAAQGPAPRVRRVEDWPAALARCVTLAARARFRWGRHDCSLFAADCVLAMTGEDLGESFRGRYATAAGAQNAIWAAGFSDLRSLVTSLLGPECGALHARRGDVVLVRPRSGVVGADPHALAVCLGPEAVAPARVGLATIDMDDWVTAWRV